MLLKLLVLYLKKGICLSFLMQLLYYSFFHSKMLVVLTTEALKLTLVLKISIKIFFVNNWLDFAL
ncbi:hypothetical protein FIM38_06815 [Helicobacter pylori]|nr:hypothetical protein FIM38_06815 [Helicobacter pylori]